MERLTQNLWKRALSMLLAFALLIPMLPAVMPRAQAASVDDYNALVQTMTDARTSIQTIAATYGTVDFGSGYTLDLQTELNTVANNITHDLGVAAAIAAGVYTDPRLTAAGVNNSNTSKGYNQTNFNTAFPDKYAAAAKYLTQGGIAVQKYSGLSLQYFFSYKSKLNPGYTASASLLGLSESGKTNIATLAQNYPTAIGSAALKLTALLEKLAEFSAAADGLQAEFLTLPCADDTCADFETTDCTDWTHRLLVPEAEFTAAVNEFKDGIDHDRKVAADLATGRIDSGLWYADKDGKNYYTGTAAGTALARLEAANAFLENGGYTCGKGNLIGGWDKRLSYRSSFNDGYEATSALGSTTFTESGVGDVLSLVDGTLGILRSGATADNLDIVYDLKVSDINAYIARAEALRGTTVPAGGTYDQAAFDAAIEDFITKAQRDLHIAAFLVSGALDETYASKWTDSVNRLKSDYAAKSAADRQACAVRFFNEGGYASGFSLLGIGYEVEYKSAFHANYSSGLFGILANKANAVAVMRDTVAALELGNKYMTALELAEYQYQQSLARLQAIKDDPSGIVAALIANDTELKQLVADLNIIVGSLDDIVSTLEAVERLGIGKEILDPVLKPLGLSYDTLQQLASLRETLSGLGIDTSGEITIEESLQPVIGGLVGVAVDLAITSANLTAQLKTEAAYQTAAGMLDTAHNQLTENAAEAIAATLAPVSQIVEPLRPYLGMLGSGLSLVNNMVALAEQVQDLSEDFTAGGIAQSSNTLAAALDDLADILEKLDETQLTAKLAELLKNGDLGGNVASGLADLLNQTVNRLIGTDLALTGSDLQFVEDTVDELVDAGLQNPTALVPLLRTSANVMRHTAKLAGGVQDIIDGNYDKVLDELGDLGNTIRKAVNLWNSIAGLFDTPQVEAPEQVTFDQNTGELNLDALDGDVFLAAFGQDINEELADTTHVLCDHNVNVSGKLARFNAFMAYLSDVRAFVRELEQTADTLKGMHQWAERNMPSEAEAKAFIETLARHYAEELRECIRDGLNSESVQAVTRTLREMKDVYCFIMSTGQLVIDAQAGEGETLYTFTTNYDPLYEQLADLLDALGITVGYTVNTPADQFYMDGNALLASAELAEGTYPVKVAYQLSFDVCDHDFAITLATKSVNVIIGPDTEEPDPELTGITLTEPTRVDYTVGDPLDLTGLVVTAQYDDETETTVDPGDYTVEPAAGTVLDTAGTVTVTVTYGEFTESFDVTVAEAPDTDPELTGIIVTPPTKTTYTVGETLDPEGMVVTAQYDDDSTRVLTNEEYALSPSASIRFEALGPMEFTVSYGECTDRFTVTVTEGQPQKQRFTVTFDPNGGTLANDAAASKTVDEGDGVTLPGAVRANYTFNGWYSGETLIGVGGAGYTPAATVTLTARWTYNGGGGGGGGGTTEIPDEDVPLAGGLTLMSLNAVPNGIVYYVNQAGTTVFVPFSFTIGTKIYFFGQSGITYAVKPNAKQFGDIGGHWAENSIQAIAAREVYQGYLDGSFRPDGAMTRAMFVSVLARMALADTSGYTERVFSDVAPDAWYGPSVAWAVDNDIAAGVGGGRFDPETAITREEIAVMFMRFIDYMGITLTAAEVSDFADKAEASAWAAEAIAGVHKYGIVSGKENNLFAPRAGSTRAEIASILHRLIEAALTEAQQTAAKTVR